MPQTTFGADPITLPFSGSCFFPSGWLEAKYSELVWMRRATWGEENGSLNHFWSDYIINTCIHQPENYFNSLKPLRCWGLSREGYLSVHNYQSTWLVQQYLHKGTQSNTMAPFLMGPTSLSISNFVSFTTSSFSSLDKYLLYPLPSMYLNSLYLCQFFCLCLGCLPSMYPFWRKKMPFLPPQNNWKVTLSVKPLKNLHILSLPLPSSIYPPNGSFSKHTLSMTTYQAPSRKDLKMKDVLSLHRELRVQSERKDL